MNSLQLSPKQLQEICHDFTNKPNGINTLLSIMLNSLMKAERKDFLVSNHYHGNKANGYRSLRGLKPLQNPKASKLLWDFQEKWHHLPKFYPFPLIKQPISGCLPPFQAAIGTISLNLLAAFNKFKHITFNTICPLTFSKPK